MTPVITATIILPMVKASDRPSAAAHTMASVRQKPALSQDSAALLSGIGSLSAHRDGSALFAGPEGSAVQIKAPPDPPVFNVDVTRTAFVP